MSNSQDFSYSINYSLLRNILNFPYSVNNFERCIGPLELIKKKNPY